MKIELIADCGNSPKNIFIKDFSIALVKGDLDFISPRISNNIIWSIIGEDQFKGRDQVIFRIKANQELDVDTLQILHAISHGKAGAVNGTMRLQGGSKIDFCNVYDFATVKYDQIISIMTYLFR